MKLKIRNNKAFTLIELLVAMGVFVVVISFAGRIFKVSLEAHRTALANAEIMQKFRAITGQLDSDFSGLDKDGEIFVAWEINPDPNKIDGFERLDRIMFFAEGDFQALGTKMIRGNAARICYSIASNSQRKPEQQSKRERILARTQHILTSDENLPDFLDPNNFTPEQWRQWNNLYQYDKISIEQWKELPLQVKIDILSIVGDIEIIGDSSTGSTSVSEEYRGLMVNPDDPNTLHMLLCQGVGDFKIQGWDDTNKRWLPEVDPDGDGDFSDTNFNLSEPNDLPGVLYPWPFSTSVEFPIDNISYPLDKVNRENFNSIPGLGRALKFTFTLYDSKGIIKEGRTFSYIVYLDD